MIVVCDSSALISLSLINQLHLLNGMYGKVLIPVGVYDEIVEIGTGRIGSDDVKNAKFIQVMTLGDPDSLSNYIIDSLGRVDAEIIAFAKEHKADLIITRDRRLIRYARQEGLDIIHIFTFLIEAKRVGLIEAVKPLLDEMKSKGVLIREGVYQETLRLADEV